MSTDAHSNDEIIREDQDPNFAEGIIAKTVVAPGAERFLENSTGIDAKITGVKHAADGLYDAYKSGVDEGTLKDFAIEVIGAEHKLEEMRQSGGELTEEEAQKHQETNQRLQEDYPILTELYDPEYVAGGAVDTNMDMILNINTKVDPSESFSIRTTFNQVSDDNVDFTIEFDKPQDPEEIRLHVQGVIEEIRDSFKTIDENGNSTPISKESLQSFVSGQREGTLADAVMEKIADVNNESRGIEVTPALINSEIELQIQAEKLEHNSIVAPAAQEFAQTPPTSNALAM